MLGSDSDIHHSKSVPGSDSGMPSHIIVCQDMVLAHHHPLCAWVWVWYTPVWLGMWVPCSDYSMPLWLGATICFYQVLIHHVPCYASIVVGLPTHNAHTHTHTFQIMFLKPCHSFVSSSLGNCSCWFGFASNVLHAYFFPINKLNIYFNCLQ